MPGPPYPAYPGYGTGSTAGQTTPVTYQGSLVPNGGVPSFLKPGPAGFISVNWPAFAGATNYTGFHNSEPVSTGSNTGATRTAIEHFLSTIGGSALELVNSTYGDNSGNVTGAIRFGGSTIVSSSTNLSDSSLQTTVSNALNNGSLPRDSNGVYFVLSSSNINETSGFCTQYCGWHTYATITGLGDIKYSFVGNPDRCPSASAAQTKCPSGNAGADGMASIIAHELEEAVSDPDLNAWYDRQGAENADKCAWTFGTTYTANGGLANMKLGTRDFLIQRNWVNANGGFCAKSY
jgi:hypothetical protein